MREYDYFISYSRNLYPDVIVPLVSALEYANLKIWFDRTCVVLGCDINENIQTVLERALLWNGAILLIDKTYLNKKWCKIEANFFIENKAEVYPLLWNIEKKDVVEIFPQLSDKNMVRVGSNSDIPLILNKIMISYILKLTPIHLYCFDSQLLNDMINYYILENCCTNNSVIIADNIVKSIESLLCNKDTVPIQIKTVMNVIHEKMCLLLCNEPLTRLDYETVSIAADYIISCIATNP